MRFKITSPFRLIGSLVIMVILGYYEQWSSVGWFFIGGTIWSLHFARDEG